MNTAPSDRTNAHCFCDTPRLSSQQVRENVRDTPVDLCSRSHRDPSELLDSSDRCSSGSVDLREVTPASKLLSVRADHRQLSGLKGWSCCEKSGLARGGLSDFRVTILTSG